MEGIIFVPGISGSQLLYKKTRSIWPPSWNDLFGYRELNELLDPKNITVGSAIDVFLDIIPIYKIIEQDLKQISAHINSVPVGPYLSLPYDWRLDLTSSSLVLDDFVTRVDKFIKSTGVTKVTFICHSMGGLLIRLLLEWKAKAPPWLDNIRRVLFICTPHLGAPTALAKICGLEGTWMVVPPWDMRRFAADKNFPSTYELLPSPDRNILFDASTNKFIRYDDPSVIAALALTKESIDKRNNLGAALNPANKPRTVSYYFAYGVGHATDEGVILNGLTLAGARPWSEVRGDGTVPSWSIIEAAAKCNPPIQTKPFLGSHIGILVTNTFRQFLYSYFTLQAPPLLVGRGGWRNCSLAQQAHLSAQRDDGRSPDSRRRGSPNIGFFDAQSSGCKWTIKPCSQSAGLGNSRRYYSISSQQLDRTSKPWPVSARFRRGRCIASLFCRVGRVLRRARYRAFARLTIIVVSGRGSG